MIADLYETLGVARDAPPEAIRKAYRSRAKKAHPDTGGSEADFALIRLAHDCLSDAKRRKRYDETGQAEETAPDTKEAQALNLVMGVIGQVLDAIERAGHDASMVDVLGHAKADVSKNIEAQKQNIAQARISAAKLRAVAKRFHAKGDKPNRIGAMLEANAVAQEQQAAQQVAVKETMELALEILGDHAFDWTAPASAPLNFGPGVGFGSGFWGAP